MKTNRKQGIIHAVLERDDEQWDRWFNTWDAFYNDTFSPAITVIFIEEY